MDVYDKSGRVVKSSDRSDTVDAGKLDDNIRISTRMRTIDIWDAPKRDRGRWMGDLDVSGRTIEDVFDDHFLMEETLDRLLGLLAFFLLLRLAHNVGGARNDIARLAGSRLVISIATSGV